MKLQFLQNSAWAICLPCLTATWPSGGWIRLVGSTDAIWMRVAINQKLGGQP